MICFGCDLVSDFFVFQHYIVGISIAYVLLLT